MMEMLTGNYDRSLASLEQPETQGIKFDSSQPPRAIARIACLRGKSLLAKGDLQLARQQLVKCRYKPSGTLMRTASSLEVWVELLAGNKEEAAEIAAKSENMLDGMHENTDRWTLGLSLADALVRLGEYARAERIYLAIASPSLKAGYEMLTANAETGLAEIAAARRDWKKSRRYADMARHRVPKNLWSITHRLDQIEIVHAYKRGDRNTSKSMLLALNAEAEKNGDVIVQTELDTMTSMMIENDNRDSRRASADRAKLRGATLNWLTSDQLSPAASSTGHH